MMELAPHSMPRETGCIEDIKTQIIKAMILYD